MVTSLRDRSEVIIWPMKDDNGKMTFEVGPIVTMSCHPWDSNAKKTLEQPTPDPSGTQWPEDLFCGKQPKIHLISTFDSSELTLPPFVEPSQTNESPIPGPSPSSESHEDIPAHEHEPEVAPMQSMEEPFGKSQLFLTFPLTISSFSHSTPLHNHHQ
ncbi:hypothetical protein O181_117013 [Austropuccinia psidii MF-1]|uniref:Uncharacterized protein n=1 Tax=Austropuccinia psidii MF-1 TaxID=1389203 RepID=A0A9Q3K9H5_9BASI|nr:hypothetical protein [Austropuccinia psidii MF-1]